MAEAVRFELTNDCSLPVFKTGAFDHSATLPQGFSLKDCVLYTKNFCFSTIFKLFSTINAEPTKKYELYLLRLL